MAPTLSSTSSVVTANSWGNLFSTQNTNRPASGRPPKDPNTFNPTKELTDIYDTIINLSVFSDGSDHYSKDILTFFEDADIILNDPKNLGLRLNSDWGLNNSRNKAIEAYQGLVDRATEPNYSDLGRLAISTVELLDIDALL
ncbi:hypothetical protein HOH87_03740 [bacterium]|jgi:hypothetical protein|nr:hypothetical protein [bacterium]